MTDFHSVLPLGEAWPIHHGHGRLAFLSTDLGSSGQLAMPAKGTVPLDTTTDMEARQSSGIFAKGMPFSLYYQYQFEQEAVWNVDCPGCPPWNDVRFTCHASAVHRTTTPPWFLDAATRNAQVEPQDDMIVQEYEQDRHVPAIVAKQVSWPADH